MPTQASVEYEQGIGYRTQALALHRQTADRIGQAHALRSLGQCYAQTEHHQQAITHFQQALILCRDIGDRHDEASNLRDLGMVLHTIGEDDEARKQFELALAILAEIRHPSAAAVQADLDALPSLPDPADWPFRTCLPASGLAAARPARGLTMLAPGWAVPDAPTFEYPNTEYGIGGDGAPALSPKRLETRLAES